MAELPAMPLFTDAYLGDTTHLTTIEHGAYMLLLIVAWRNGGHLPNDDRLLAKFARMTKPQWERVKPTIMDFFTVEGENIYQRRQRDEYAFILQRRQLRSNAGRRGGQAKSLKTNDPAVAMLKQTDSKSEAPTPTPIPKKEREDKSSPKKATAWKDGEPVPDEWLAWAMGERGWSRQQAKTEAERFTDYALANRKTYANWMAAWRQWCRSPFQKTEAQTQRRLTI